MGTSAIYRYVIRIKDPSTNEVESEVDHQFISVSRAREHIMDLLIRTKQFPCDVQYTLHSKHCADNEETYALVIVYFRKRNERIYYHIHKVEVSKESLMAEIDDIVADNTKPIPNPFDLMKKKE
jgi:hypothetical protein